MTHECKQRCSKLCKGPEAGGSRQGNELERVTQQKRTEEAAGTEGHYQSSGSHLEGEAGSLTSDVKGLRLL